MSFPAHARAILSLGLPLIGGHLAQILIGVTDTMMLGWYGVTEVAALTVAGSFYFSLFLMGAGFAWAVMPMVASYAAEKDETAIRRCTRMGLWLSIGFAAACMPLMLFAEPILLALRQTEDVARLGAQYLQVAGWGLFPALMVMTLKSYLAALERTQVVFWMTVLAACVNALANYALIFGHWGLPEMGITGAALASLATQGVMLLGVILYAVTQLPKHQLFVRLWRADGEMMGRVYRLGWPIGLTTLSETGLFTATAFMMGWLGEIAQAAHGFALQIASLTFMVHMGLSNVATIRAGNALGRRDFDHMARGAQTVVALSLAMSLATVVLFLAVPELLLSPFLGRDLADRAEILRIAVLLLAMAALFQIVDGAQVVALGLLRGVHDTKQPMIVAALSYWGVGLPCSYVFGFVFDWQGVGVWLGLVTGLACAGAALMVRFWHRSLPRLRTAPDSAVSS